jgi:hypothetical protein
MNSSAYQPQQHTDVRHFVEFSSKLSALCQQVKVKEMDRLTGSDSTKNTTADATTTAATGKGSGKGGKKGKNKKDTATTTTPSIPGLPESHNEVVVASHVNDIVENNFLVAYLKEQHAKFTNEAATDDATTKSTASPDSSTETTLPQPTTQEILQQYPLLRRDFTGMEEYLPLVENKLQVNSLMSVVGANFPLPLALSQLSGLYPLLFQKDAFGRTLLHHFCGLTSINPNMARETDESGVYSTITAERLAVPHRAHLGQDETLTKVIEPTTHAPVLSSTSSSQLPLPSHITTDHRLVLLSRDHVSAPIDLQPKSIQLHFKAGKSWDTLNPDTQIPTSTLRSVPRSPWSLSYTLRMILSQNLAVPLSRRATSADLS